MEILNYQKPKLLQKLSDSFLYKKQNLLLKKQVK